MFVLIELLAMLLLLWFIVNFIHYALWASSGYEGPRGAMFAMSNSWITDAKAKRGQQKPLPDVDALAKARLRKPRSKVN
jgi:hypothetical protein